MRKQTVVKVGYEQKLLGSMAFRPYADDNRKRKMKIRNATVEHQR